MTRGRAAPLMQPDSAFSGGSRLSSHVHLLAGLIGDERSMQGHVRSAVSCNRRART